MTTDSKFGESTDASERIVVQKPVGMQGNCELLLHEQGRSVTLARSITWVLQGSGSPECIHYARSAVSFNRQVA